MNAKKKMVVFYLGVILAVLAVSLLGNRTVTVLSETMPIQRENCIIIDPGHGGEDGGATSCSGILESAYNLDISMRLNDLLHLMGYDTRMTRTSDISIYTNANTIAQKKISDLKERVRIVNETKNGLLLSIHQNNFRDSKYFGPQVFYADTDGSQELAQQLQKNLVSNLCKGSNRKEKKISGVYLMEHIQCTSVLVECGFLSNPSEEAKLRDPKYQKQLCCVIASTVSQFLSNT